jgi:hypothetical protein
LADMKQTRNVFTAELNHICGLQAPSIYQAH